MPGINHIRINIPGDDFAFKFSQKMTFWHRGLCRLILSNNARSSIYPLEFCSSFYPLPAHLGTQHLQNFQKEIPNLHWTQTATLYLDYQVPDQGLPMSLWLASSLLHPSGQGSSTWEKSILLGMVELSHELEALRLNKLSRERRIFFLRLNTLERKDVLPRNRANYSCWAGTEL